MLATWWDNLQESCDTRMMAGTATAVCWLLLLAVSPVFSAAPTLIAQGISWRLVAVACTAILFSVSLLAAKRFGGSRNLRFTVPVIAGCAAAFFGVLLHRFASHQFMDDLGAAFVAFGVVALCFGWALPFSEIRLRKRVVASAAGAICGCVLYFCIVAVPQPFALFIGACLPIASAMCWIALRSKQAEPEGVRSDAESATATPHSSEMTKQEQEHPTKFARPNCSTFLHPYGRELSAAIGLYGMLFVLAGHVLPETESVWVLSVVPGVINVGAFFLIEIALSVYMVKRIHRENPVVAYRPATILVAVAFFFLPFASPEIALFCMAIAFAGFGSFMVFFWIVMGNITQKWKLPFLRVYAQGFLTLLAGIAVGELIAWFLTSIRQPGFDYVATLSIVSLFLLVAMAWQMSDGSRFANETKEMGGQYFDFDIQGSSGEKGPSYKMSTLDTIAHSYRLSPRETEVLELLLKGRSIPYICDELFIAKSTAQTHVRHIYSKMEITGGRQELIDRIEKSGEY
ncbi:response regulator transcription factor [Raoultibacter phocaeensis]|uniref:response regulator transcription factor n=1 Tax=Raoultibacter phocaeensis TaxID=2479841 RepID=UPI0011181BAD|nr:LuxR C-terminal-related transcriptional regulator [Raoultibacter phocaeensis]